MRQPPPELPDPELWSRCYGATYPPNFAVGTHEHAWDQVTLTASGMARVIADGQVWLVPPQHALLVPAGVPHDLVSSGPLALRTMYFHPGTLTGVGPACHAIQVEPLLRELVLHAVRRGRLRRDDPHESACLVILRALIAAQPPASMALALPSDARARRAACVLLEESRTTDDIEALAGEVGASRRTLERAFVAETGLTIGRWRQRLRLLRSLPLLADRMPVSAVAYQVGYESVSAFVARFREVFGTTPAQFYTSRSSEGEAGRAGAAG